MSVPINIKQKTKAQQALLFLVPVASIGVTFATYISPGIIGQGIFTLSKIWLVIFPWWWRLKIERKNLKLPGIDRKQINLGIALGLVMAGAIILCYWFVGKQFLDITTVREQAIEAGITQVNIYFLAILYWSFVNAFIEECVWRGFVYRHCQTIFNVKSFSIIISALFFTTHHVIGLCFYLQNFGLAMLSSLGVFIAGVIWSACYQKSGFWVCYLSHIIADLAIGFAGWHLLFAS